MKSYSTTNLEKELREARFVRLLKLDRVAISRSGKQFGWLVPESSVTPEDLTILEYVSTKTFKGQIGYEVNRLQQAKFRGKIQPAIGLIDSEGDLLCYLVIDKNLVKANF